MKLVRESLNELAGSFYPEAKMGGNLFSKICKKDYWEKVAEKIGGRLLFFDQSDYTRSLEMESHEGKSITIEQDWDRDGSPTKPSTTINGQNIGRFAIWDDPEMYAEDILKELSEYDDEDADEDNEDSYGTEEGNINY